MKALKISFFALLLLCSISVTFAQTFKDSYGKEFTYKGELKNGKPDGIGVATFDSKSNIIKYEGFFKNGKRSGVGTMYFKSGRKYMGFWKKDNREVFGKYTYRKDGGSYTGEFKMNKSSGIGKQDLNKGAYIFGEFKNSVSNGYGLLKYPESSTLELEVGRFNKKKNLVGNNYVKRYSDGKIKLSTRLIGSTKNYIYFDKMKDGSVDIRMYHTKKNKDYAHFNYNALNDRYKIELYGSTTYNPSKTIEYKPESFLSLFVSTNPSVSGKPSLDTTKGIGALFNIKSSETFVGEMVNYKRQGKGIVFDKFGKVIESKEWMGDDFIKN